MTKCKLIYQYFYSILYVVNLLCLNLLAEVYFYGTLEQ